MSYQDLQRANHFLRTWSEYMIYCCHFHVNMNSFLSSFLSEAAISLTSTLDLLWEMLYFR